MSGKNGINYSKFIHIIIAFMFFRKAFRDCTGDYFEKVGVKMHCACPIYCGGYFAKDLFNEENLR